MGKLAAIWGVLGVSFFVGSAAFRLSIYSLDAFRSQLNWQHWLFLVIFTIFMGVSEGYRGFQKQFSPRVIARALYLWDNPTLTRTLLAPLFCMGFFHATKKRLMTSYILTVAIAVMILVVRQFPQPWRGLIDVGVVFGLLWGLIAIFAFAIQIILRKEFSYSPETPDSP